jgi:hypothetical protein
MAKTTSLDFSAVMSKVCSNSIDEDYGSLLCALRKVFETNLQIFFLKKYPDHIITESRLFSWYRYDQEQFLRNFVWKHRSDLFLKEINGIPILKFLFKDLKDHSGPDMSPILQLLNENLEVLDCIQKQKVMDGSRAHKGIVFLISRPFYEKLAACLHYLLFKVGGLQHYKQLKSDTEKEDFVKYVSTYWPKVSRKWTVHQNFFNIKMEKIIRRIHENHSKEQCKQAVLVQVVLGHFGSKTISGNPNESVLKMLPDHLFQYHLKPLLIRKSIEEMYSDPDPKDVLAFFQIKPRASGAAQI